MAYNGDMDLNELFLKAMKSFNFISGCSTDEEEIKKHRQSVERVSRLAAPKGKVSKERFKIGNISCEAVKSIPNFNPHYAIMYVHGGGYMSGGLDYAGILASKLARATGFTTFSFDYRLAPEHVYPAAIEDGTEIWNYLTSGLYSASHLLLAGDSAGGNLALCLTQKLLAEGKKPPRELILFSPWTDMTGESDSVITNEEIDPVLSKEFVKSAASAYISGAGDPADPRFSPLFGNFEGFPSTYIMVGKNEILFDDSSRLREKIADAGGKAFLDIEEKGWHVYQQFPVRIASQAFKRLSTHIRREMIGDIKK